MHHPYYAGFVFGNAWGKVSAAAHCKAAKARYNQGKKHYSPSGIHTGNIQTQIAKWCTEADQIEEEQKLLFGTNGGSSLPPLPAPAPGGFTPGGYVPPATGAGTGTGEEEESSMLLPIIGLVALAALGGGAVLLFMKPKKKKKGKKKK